MNIALWLERAGKSHASLPAAALGGRVVLDYGALAMRAARLAAALRTKLKLDAGDRVAIVARNCVEYLETVYAVWHAGLAAVPANAKLHGAELGYVLEHIRVHGPASPRRASTPSSRPSRRRRSRR